MRKESVGRGERKRVGKRREKEGNRKVGHVGM